MEKKMHERRKTTMRLTYIVGSRIASNTSRRKSTQTCSGIDKLRYIGMQSNPWSEDMISHM